jgi:hypothetical protein
MTALAEWENFYVIIGSSAGALIGLQFVVLTLMADMPAANDLELATNAFTTPSLVHFQAVLLLSAIVSAPWSGFTTVAVLWTIMGVCGIAYSFIVARRLKKQSAYDPVFEDWFYYVLLPLVGYLTLIVSACASQFRERPALFGVAGGALLLLFAGIHNAWDLVTHMVYMKRRHREQQAEKPSKEKR